MEKKPKGVNYYRILNVHQKAKFFEIKKAYMKLAKLYHPDKNREHPLAEKKFRQINSAYQILKDPEKRKQLDESLREFEKSPKKFLGNLPSPPLPFPSGKEKGIDLELALKVSIEDLCQSRPLSLNYLRPVNGSKKKSFLQVRIPPNAKAGSKLCFRDKGGAEGVKKFGKLYVRLELKPHKIFKVKQDFDLFMERPLPFISALEASRVDIPSPYGEFLSLKWADFFENRRVFKIKGKGLPKDLKGTKGDLYVRILLEYPQKKESEIKAQLRGLSPSEKKALLRKFKEEFIFPKTLKFEKRMREMTTKKVK